MSQFIFKDGYYCLSYSSKWKYAVYDTNNISLDEVSSIMNNKDQSDQIDNIASSLFYIAKKDGEITEKVDLPLGTYNYVPGNGYNTVSRLVPTSYRKDEQYIGLSTMDDLNKDINLFLNSKNIYDDFKTLYRRGYLLYGEPGNGKTSLIRELTKNKVETSHIIWASSVPEDAILEALNKTESTKFAIFEDIVNNLETGLNVADFLEFMDGENTLKNCITIATTNYPHKLEANLANRPSRFDVVYNVKNPPTEVAYKILTSYLGRDVSEEITPTDLSFAQLKEICLLHRMYGISLTEAQKKMQEASDIFKNDFEDKKSFGL